MIDALIKPQLYLSENQGLPYRRVLVEVKDSQAAFFDYLGSTGEMIDEVDTFSTALKLVSDSALFNQRLKEHTARTWARFNQIANIEEYLDLITRVSESLFYELIIKRLYVNGSLPYLFEQAYGNRVLLCSKDVYISRILNELRRAPENYF